MMATRGRRAFPAATHAQPSAPATSPPAARGASTTTTTTTTSSPSPAPSPPFSGGSAVAASPARPPSVWDKASNPLTAASSHVSPVANGTAAAAADRQGRDRAQPKPAAAAASPTNVTAPTASSPTTPGGATSPPASAAATTAAPSSVSAASASSVPAATLASVLQIGNVVRVTTLLHEVIEGVVYVHDSAAQVVALQLQRPAESPPQHPHSAAARPASTDYTLCNTSTITSAQLIRRHTAAASPPPPSASSSSSPSASSSSPSRRSLPDIDVGKLAAKERRALEHRQLEASRIGVGVSERGQRVFDALCKLYGARWEGDSIVLLHAAMRLSAPYGAAELTGGNSQQRERIIKTIEAQREKEDRKDDK